MFPGHMTMGKTSIKVTVKLGLYLHSLFFWELPSLILELSFPISFRRHP